MSQGAVKKVSRWQWTCEHCAVSGVEGLKRDAVAAHREHGRIFHSEVTMRFWQRYCLWHADCTCGANATGYDGAEAMRALNHRGHTVRGTPVGYHITAP